MKIKYIDEQKNSNWAKLTCCSNKILDIPKLYSEDIKFRYCGSTESEDKDFLLETEKIISKNIVNHWKADKYISKKLVKEN